MDYLLLNFLLQAYNGGGGVMLFFLSSADFCFKISLLKNSSGNTLRMSNNLDADLGPNYLQR